MIELPAFGGLLQEHGFTFFSGVPCPFLQGLINYALNHLDYCAAANEGAVAIAAGAALGGRASKGGANCFGQDVGCRWRRAGNGPCAAWGAGLSVPLTSLGVLVSAGRRPPRGVCQVAH
jgi:hypothetical protein